MVYSKKPKDRPEEKEKNEQVDSKKPKDCPKKKEKNEKVDSKKSEDRPEKKKKNEQVSQLLFLVCCSFPKNLIENFNFS
ncbi:hypothetical protein GE061_020069 [Apolygus lucorum]|uniref:Uncharacterized protein n=1 Tax=Apolygus lucorum TaxID=248454 RepID=A0A8S9XBI0_APOLU|nr:hypothetical protein GE061_020069 [Apolygus lucorum]